MYFVYFRVFPADWLSPDSFLPRLKRFGFTDNNLPSVELLFNDVDDTFFLCVLINSHHVFQLVLGYNNNMKLNIISELNRMTIDKLHIPKTADLNDDFYCP